MADSYTKGQSVWFGGDRVTISQVIGNRAIVRMPDGSAKPVMTAQLRPSEEAIPEAEPATPSPQNKTPPPVRVDVKPSLRMLYEACSKWQLIDGFGFHQRLREAVEQNVVKQADLAEHFDVSLSTVRNWTTGSMRPPPKIQQQVIARIIQAIEIAANNDSMESAEDDVPDTAPPQSASDELAALEQARQFIDVAGRILTIELTQVGPQKWVGLCEEIPSLTVETESKMEAVLDLKALAVDYIAKRSAAPQAKTEEPTDETSPQG